MLHRAIIVGVAAFWLIMTGLYVRLQVAPSEQPSWMSIPPGHVINLVFGGDESSALDIFQNGLKIGTLYVRPFGGEGVPGERRIAVNGEISIKFPGARERMTFRSEFNFSREFETLNAFDFSMRLRDPEFELAVSSGEGSGVIDYRATGPGGDVLREGSGTLGGILADTPLAGAGLRAEDMLPAMAAGAPRAVRGTATLAGQPVEVYRLIIPHGNDLRSEINVSLLGRILSVSTPFGIHLLTEGIDQ